MHSHDYHVFTIIFVNFARTVRTQSILPKSLYYILNLADYFILIFTNLQNFIYKSTSSHCVVDVPQGSVLGPLLFILYTADIILVVRSEMVDYPDHSPWGGIVAAPAAANLLRTLRRDITIGELGSFWVMKLDSSLTNKMVA